MVFLISSRETSERVVTESKSCVRRLSRNVEKVWRSAATTLEQEVRLAGHDVALQDFGDAGDDFPELRQVLQATAAERDADEREDAEPEALPVETRRISVDHAGFLETLDAAEALRRRQMGGLRELRMRRAGVVLQPGQDPKIGGVQLVAQRFHGYSDKCKPFFRFNNP